LSDEGNLGLSGRAVGVAVGHGASLGALPDRVLCVVVSKSQADKAGERLRHAVRSTEPPDQNVVLASYITMCDWRGQHAATLAKTVMGLRSAVQSTCGYQAHGRVVSRMKREGQILRKLVNERTALSRMADIAGCRAVLANLDDVEAVAERLDGPLARKLEVIKTMDYVSGPQDLGYRAIHLHALRDGYRVEIQLRTVRQHDWAERVERYDKMTGEDAKHGDADPAALNILRALGAEFATLDLQQRSTPLLPLQDG
jgi:putative GTP pyrophosphokinase